MSVNETRPSKADVIFAVKEGSSPSSATFVFGCVFFFVSPVFSALARLVWFKSHARDWLLVGCRFKVFEPFGPEATFRSDFLRLTINAGNVNVISVAAPLCSHHPEITAN